MTFKKTAFSLIELIMVITIVGILSAALSAYIGAAVDIWDFVSFRTEMVNDARMTLVRMGSELRQISKANITNATSSILVYKSSGNATINRYRYSNPNLFYEIDTDKDGSFESSEPSNNLLNHATAFSFTYFNSSGGVTTVLSQIYSMKVNLTVSDPTARGGGSKVNLTYGIFPRN